MFGFYTGRIGATLLPFAVAALLPLTAQAETITLNFGDFRQATFGSTDLTMQMAGVAPGINATLTAANTFPSYNANANGASNGDLRVNLQRGNSIELTLALWDATSGYETAYDPGVDFDWDLVFYDLDGVPGNTTDNITLLSASAYTLTTSTQVTVDKSVPGQVTFIGGGGTNVPSSPGMGSLTQEQADVSVSVQVSNMPYLNFIYEATGTQNSGRNLFVNGGTLSLAGFETETGNVAPVPLPAGILLMLTGVAALGGARRLRAKRAA